MDPQRPITWYDRERAADAIAFLAHFAYQEIEGDQSLRRERWRRMLLWRALPVDQKARALQQMADALTAYYMRVATSEEKADAH